MKTSKLVWVSACLNYSVIRIREYSDIVDREEYLFELYNREHPVAKFYSFKAAFDYYISEFYT